MKLLVRYQSVNPFRKLYGPLNTINTIISFHIAPLQKPLRCVTSALFQNSHETLFLFLKMLCFYRNNTKGILMFSFH